MATATVEEAWAAFMNEQVVTDYFGGFAQTTIDAVRTLAAAVLEQVEESGCVYPFCDHPCTDCPIEALRKQIEALGTR